MTNIDGGGPSDKPEPLVPVDTDARNFPYTPIFRAQLFGSTFHAKATDEEWRAGVTLWLKSWDQTPPGSLPMGDVELCRLAELGRDLKAWMRVRDVALHGWFEANNGRLYHGVVAEGICSALLSKEAQRLRTAAAREARLRQRLSQSPAPSVTDSVTSNVTTSVVGAPQTPTKHNITKHNITKPPIPPLHDVETEFAIWYADYPHKIGRKAAHTAFARARKSVSVEVLTSGLQRYIRTKPADRPWCNPATWLNQERWLDQPQNSPGEANGTPFAHVPEQDAPRTPPPRLPNSGIDEPFR